MNLGELHFDAGDFEAASRFHRASLEINRKLAPRGSGVAWDTFRIAETLRHQGLFDMADAHYEKALALQNELGEVIEAARTRIGLAQLELERDNFGRALDLARQAALGLQDAGDPDLLALARIVEAQTQLQSPQGDRGAARLLLEEARLQAELSADRRTGFEVGLLDARLRDDPAESASLLKALIRRAEAGGDLLYAERARRVLAMRA